MSRSLDDIVTCIAVNGSDLWFEINGKKAGVSSTAANSIVTFQAWCGKKIKEYTTVDEVLHDPFFDGKSLAELADSDVFR